MAEESKLKEQQVNIPRRKGGRVKTGKGDKPRHDIKVYNAKYPECIAPGCRRMKSKGRETCLEHIPCDECNEMGACDANCLYMLQGIDDELLNLMQDLENANVLDDETGLIYPTDKE